MPGSSSDGDSMARSAPLLSQRNGLGLRRPWHDRLRGQIPAGVRTLKGGRNAAELCRKGCMGLS